MTFLEAWLHGVRTFPRILFWVVLPLGPFLVLERMRPIGPRPRWSEYALNIGVSLSTSFLILPVGIVAGLCGRELRALLPWTPGSFSFGTLAHIPFVGPALETLAMIFVPVVLHDAWFYWAHRIEHGVPFLWELHKLHHSDQRMNSSTFARDHFLQAVWTAFFPICTLGLCIDLDLEHAGKAALYSNVFLVIWTMFSHSAIRVSLPWLDRVLVTPQVHRLHHSRHPAHYDSNFADAVPLFDILFGTYRRPGRDEFPATGLPETPGPRSVWAAQLGPLGAAARALSLRVRGRRRPPARA